MDKSIDQMVQEAALDAGLPISVVRGVVQQESQGFPKATRYEPGFYLQYICKGWVATLLKKLKLGLDSAEAKGRATSWGLMQVMGQSAREMGFTGPFSDLLIPEVGLYWGCKHLAIKKRLYFARYGWAGVLSAYNAGSPLVLKSGKYKNQHYVDGSLRYASQGVA